MANFAIALPFTLSMEGGWQARTDDPGNASTDGLVWGTNMGITRNTLTAWRKQTNGLPPKPEDLKNLAYSEASAIYEALYWKPCGCPVMMSDRLATVVFDAAVVCGVSTVVRLMQAQVALNGGGLVGIDGQAGPNTMKALSRCDQEAMAHGLIDALGDRFSDLVIANGALLSWLGNWRRRRSKWRKLALSL